jgi:hypothetical protein
MVAAHHDGEGGLYSSDTGQYELHATNIAASTTSKAKGEIKSRRTHHQLKRASSRQTCQSRMSSPVA